MNNGRPRSQSQAQLESCMARVMHGYTKRRFTEGSRCMFTLYTRLDMKPWAPFSIWGTFSFY